MYYHNMCFALRIFLDSNILQDSNAGCAKYSICLVCYNILHYFVACFSEI